MTIAQQYVVAYRNVILAVSSVESYVTPALAWQVDWFEARMTEEEIERLRDIARNSL